MEALVHHNRNQVLAHEAFSQAPSWKFGQIRTFIHVMSHRWCSWIKLSILLMWTTDPPEKLHCHPSTASLSTEDQFASEVLCQCHHSSYLAGAFMIVVWRHHVDQTGKGNGIHLSGSQSLSTRWLHTLGLRGVPHTLQSTCECWDHTKSKLSVPDWGFMRLIGWRCCGSAWKLFMHEWEEWSGGERICVSHYIKDNVHECLKVPQPIGQARWYLSLVENRLGIHLIFLFLFFKVT